MKKYLVLFLVTFFCSCYQESIIPIEGEFATSFVGNDQSVPVIIKIDNKVTGADTYKWTFTGGIPSNSTQKSPGEISYAIPGIYEIELKVENSDGEKKTITKSIDIKDAINIVFTNQIVMSNFPPVEVHLTNNTVGAGLTQTWTFQGGSPSTFTGATPPNVVFAQPGIHDIILTVTNGFETQNLTQSITVAPNLENDFSWIPNFEDEDYQSPVTINLVNQSVSATNYSWTFQGGNPSNSTNQNPQQVTFTTGLHQITLVASNDKTSLSLSKTINVLPDTNLSVLNNVIFGITSAHNSNSVGAFYSTTQRTNYKANEVNSTNGSLIDIAFQGLNSGFTYNKFISPNLVSNSGFLPITNAPYTIFINSQNTCNCGLNFTVSNFDSMTNDSPLQPLNINYSAAGLQEFNLTLPSILPRIVLFKTQSGRKGAIKITNYVQNGSNSYIVCDIKVQKQ